MLSHQVLNHVQLQCNLQVVVVVHTQRNRYAVLFSTDVNLEPQRLYRYDKARFQIEFLLRDAKQFTGLSDCQARSKAQRDFHFNPRARCNEADIVAPLGIGHIEKLATSHAKEDAAKVFQKC